MISQADNKAKIYCSGASGASSAVSSATSRSAGINAAVLPAGADIAAIVGLIGVVVGAGRVLA